MTTLVVGIDCATENDRTGVAFAVQTGDRCTIEHVQLADDELAQTIAARGQQHARTLIAIDAPLGWPRALGQALADHQAGLPLLADANALFARDCDRFVHERIGKKPLDVGADRIARTAHRALERLARIAKVLRTPVALAFEPTFTGTAAIEVYPAATMLACGMAPTRYKRAEDTARRVELLQQLSEQMEFTSTASELALTEPDVLDAMVCALAGHHFLAGQCDGPTDRSVAEREGWIWFARAASERAPRRGRRAARPALR